MKVESTLQLNINSLKKSGYIREGEIKEGNYQAQAGDIDLYLNADCSSSNRTLNIKYTALNGSEMDYVIKLDAIQSNFGNGRGFNFFFIDPDGVRAKILYYCNERHVFLSRMSFKKRLRYTFENYRTPHKLFAYSQYNQTKILNAFLQMKRETHGGLPTRINKKIGKLIDRKILIDRLISEYQKKNG